MTPRRRLLIHAEAMIGGWGDALSDAAFGETVALIVANRGRASPDMTPAQEAALQAAVASMAGLRDRARAAP